MEPGNGQNLSRRDSWGKRVGLARLFLGGFGLLVSVVLVVLCVMFIGNSPPNHSGPEVPPSGDPQRPSDLPLPPVPVVYTLTVRNGLGSGKYPEGTMVSISAGAPLQAQVFDNWTTNNGGSFLADSSIRTVFTMPGNEATVTANYVAIDSSFSGQYLSERGKSKYEIDFRQSRFSYYTLIGERFVLQTEISPYEVHRVDGREEREVGSIAISGMDNRAGGGPTTSLRLTKISESDFRLERIQPFGGDLGVFRKQP